MTDIDPFAEDPIDRIDGMPQIIPPGGGDPVSYTRASSLGSYLTDDRFLLTWKMRYLAVAMGRYKDLADQCAVEPYTTGFAEPERMIKSASGKRLDGFIERALDRMLIDERADRGTVVHAVTEQDYDGFVPISVITELAVMNEWLAINNVQRVGSEIFVVNDELRVAGTFDHLFYINGYGLVIGDTKNGRNTNELGFGCQFGNYAHSEVYDPETGARKSLQQYVLDEYGFDPGPINHDVALLLSLKAGQDGGYGELKVSDVDIEWGYRKAQQAAAVRDARTETAGRVLQSKTLKHVKGKKAKELAHQAILDRLAGAATYEELLAIWRQYQPIWTEEHTKASQARRDELEAQQS